MTPDDLVALTFRPGPGRHIGTTFVDGKHVETLADLPPLRNGLLFVGLSPSPESVEAGHYHQGQLGRTFWRRLMTARIIPAETPVETADDALVAAGHGITDLLKVPTAPDDATDLRRWRRASDRSGRRSPSGVRARSCSSTSGRPTRRRAGHSPNPGVNSSASPWPDGRAS